MNEIAKEYKKAKDEKRQPNCPYCGEPLTVGTARYEKISWEWSETKKQYIEIDDASDPETPFCMSCGRKDWGFWNFIYFKLADS